MKQQSNNPASPIETQPKAEVLPVYRDHLLMRAVENIGYTYSRISGEMVASSPVSTFEKQVADNLQPVEQSQISEETQATVTDLNLLRMKERVDSALAGQVYPLPGGDFESYAEKAA